MTLAFLKQLGHSLCEITFHLNLSDRFLMIRFILYVFDQNTTGVILVSFSVPNL